MNRAAWRAFGWWGLVTRIPLLGKPLRGVAAARLGRRANASPEWAARIANGLPDYLGDHRPLRLAALELVRKQGSVDAIVRVWARTREPELRAFLLARSWSGRSPRRVALLSRLLVGKTAGLTSMDTDDVEHLVHCANDGDPVVSTRAAAILRVLERDRARAALCRLALREDLPVARDAVIEAGFVPRDPGRKALFLVLTGQWDRYDEFDVEGRLLGAAYHAAERDVKTRVATRIREAGRVELLHVLSGGTRQEHADIDVADARVIQETLAAAGAWRRLFELLPTLPIPAAIQAVRALQAAGYTGENENDGAALELLAKNAADPLWDTFDRHKPAVVRLPEPTVLLADHSAVQVAIDPSETRLLASTRKRRAVLLNLETGTTIRTTQSYHRGVCAVGFTGDGTPLYAVEVRRRRSRPRTIIWSWNEDKPRQAFAIEGHARALAAYGPGRALCATHRGGLFLLDFEHREIVSDLQASGPTWFSDEGGLEVEPEGSRVIAHRGRHGPIRLIDVDEPRVLATSRDLVVGGRVILATFAPDGRAIVAALESVDNSRPHPHTERRVVALEKSGTELVPRGPALHERRSNIRAIASLRRGGALLTLAGDALQATSWADNRPLARAGQSCGLSPRLLVSADERWLALFGNWQDGVRLWDLRLVGVLLFASSPARTVPAHALELDLLLTLPDLTRSEDQILRFVRDLLRLRLRYSVEVGDAPTIEGDGYDIEIEPEAE